MQGSGRITPTDLNMSQIDIDVCQSFLSRFLPEKELWELTPEDQIGILGLVLNRVLELRSFKDYISQEGLSETARNLEDKIGKQTEQISSLEKELSSTPNISDVVDNSLLSRSQCRERAEILKQRETLGKKIEESKEKLEELLKKFQQEKLARSYSKRISPIGEDRHFRRYFWFNLNSLDDGIWIQDMGISKYEKFVRACIKAGKSFEVDNDESKEDCVQASSRPNENCSNNIEFNAFQSKPNGDCTHFEHDRCTEVWWKISDEKSLDDLVNSLNRIGVREGKLKSFLLKKRKVILDSLRNESTQDSEIDEEEDLCSEAITPLRNSIVQLTSDLASSYFTNIIAVEDFEAQKSKFSVLADSITPSAIVRRLDFKTACQTGHNSVMNLDRWKQCLSECQNASGVHLLRTYLDSRINWKNSVVEKRCSSCGSRRSAESKISCSNCFLVIHYYCTRPKLQEKPATWLCSTCASIEEKKKKEVFMERFSMKKATNKVNYCEDSSDNESVNSPSCGSESDDDDFFVSKRRRFGRKRVLRDHFANSGSSTGGKRSRSDSVTKECLEVLNKIKASNRLYRTLQNIPLARTNRRSTVSSIDGLEEAISEEHNGRKLEELEKILLEVEPTLLTKT
ncbi:hypothetical protein DICVIV_04993 [Dictyocaulus viviparus]|uniref:Zinc finger PHD-type domain-containing protein n=1 Tax=Dictyocaulus viviparus TaxID=29172 RepID=A0A0D8XYF0_DICVI|nr:hypothetical protein DICVIV_04993 [Dictyocaulus viviparus]